MTEKDNIKNMIEFTTGEEKTEQDPIMAIPAELELFVKSMDDGRALIQTDFALLKVAPVPRLRWLFGIQIEIQEPDDDGFYTAEEEKTILAMQDRMIAVMHDEGHCRFVGSVTYAGMRMLYFYGKDENYLAPLVGKLAAEFDDYDINFMSELDGQWGFFFNALYPNELDLAHIRNRGMVQQLMANGWDLDRTYPVYYYFYFQDGASRAQAASRLMLIGFEIIDDHIFEEALEPMSMGLKVLGRHDLNYITLTEKTYDVYEVIEDYIAICDGWEIAMEEMNDNR